MVDGIAELSGFPLSPFNDGNSAAGACQWDSRECPGPNTEAELSRPSTRRVLTAGALVLAVIAPAVEPVERPAEAGAVTPSSPPEAATTPVIGLYAAFPTRPSVGKRVSRSAIRRAATPVRRIVVRARRVVRKVVEPTRVRREARSLIVRKLAKVRRRITFRHIRTVRAPRGMQAVLAFARTQVGKSYVSGGSGGNGFDCSGLTRAAYARAGLRLPHSSGAQAARARSISRAQARPGDLVVGPGHVGLYMGGGMMIDAGNHRTGVVYRHLYQGLRIKRF
jgi:hypothetical protein